MTACQSPPERRLLTLLRTRRADVHPFSFATDETLAAARALPAEVAADAVSSVLADYVPGGNYALAERAAHVAHELGLAGAIPALVACVARLPHGDPVASVACAALEFLGRPAVEPLLDALGRVAGSGARFAVGAALALMPRDDGRVGAALASMLGHDPEIAAELLGLRGDRSALPALRAALDRLELPSQGGPEVEGLGAIVALGDAIAVLRGRPTAAQREKVQRAQARFDELVAGALDGPARQLH